MKEIKDVIKEIDKSIEAHNITSEEIGDSDREGGFQETGMAEGLEEAKEIILKYFPE